MAFTRNFLLSNGVPEDKVDAIMAERNRTLADYVPKADAEKAQADAVKAALEEAKQAPADVSKHPDYIKLQGEYDGYKQRMTAKASDDYKEIKGKFFDAVYDRIEKDKPVSDQLAAIKKDFPEYFVEEQAPTQQTTRTPVFSNQSPPPGKTVTDEERVAADFMSGFDLPPNARRVTKG